MKKILVVGVGMLLVLTLLGCTNYATTRRVNALYDKVNDMQLRIVNLEKKVEELNTKIREIEGPPTADITTLQKNLEDLNDDFIRLARELAKTQEKIGLPPIEVVPSKAK